MKKQKRVLCLWSGGVDSTYMVDHYLSKGYVVDTLYVNFSNNQEKTKREKKAQDLIYDVLRSSYSTTESTGCLSRKNYSEVTVSARNMNLLLLQGMICSLAEHVSGHDIVAVGYVMNDDAVSFIPEIKKLWKSLLPFMHNKAKLEFPIVKLNKYHIWHSLRDDLKPLVTWCESGDALNEPCGKCTPCKRNFEEIHGGDSEKATPELIHTKQASKDFNWLLL